MQQDSVIGVENALIKLHYEPLEKYIVATAYENETVTDRSAESRAFVDRFETDLICFRSSGLSRPYSCVISIEQQ